MRNPAAELYEVTEYKLEVINDLRDHLLSSMRSDAKAMAVLGYIDIVILW